MEVALARGEPASGPERLEQAVAVRAARMEREVDEQLERALRPPRGRGDGPAVDLEPRRAEQHEPCTRRTRLSRGRAAGQPRVDVAQRGAGRTLERPPRLRDLGEPVAR